MNRSALLALAVALSVVPACRHAGSSDGSVRTARVSAADGVPIVYDVRGDGEPAVVFIHCWGGDRTYWDGVVDVVDDTHRVVTIDLPGHGESGAGRRSWSLPGLAADVVTVMEEVSLERAILVGHSMGGPVSLDVARRLPGRIVGIVAVDTLHDAELVWPEEMKQQILAAFEADFEKTVRDFVGQMLPPETDPRIQERIIATALRTDRKAATALMRAFGDYDMPAALSAARVPIRAINAAPRPPIGPETNVSTNRKYADFDVVIMEGIGHYPMLERPAAFNEQLRRVLASFERR